MPSTDPVAERQPLIHCVSVFEATAQQIGFGFYFQQDTFCFNKTTVETILFTLCYVVLLVGNCGTPLEVGGVLGGWVSSDMLMRSYCS